MEERRGWRKVEEECLHTIVYYELQGLVADITYSGQTPRDLPRVQSAP